jgi:uncharacterized membrane protein YqjE
MSAEENKIDAQAPETHCEHDEAVETEELEERRASRVLKTWLVKVFTLSFIVIMFASVGTLIYMVVVQEKDLNTTFIGEVLKGVFEVVKFALN